MKPRLVDRAPFTALGLLWPFGVPASMQAAGPAGDAAGLPFRLVTANALRTNRRTADWARAVLALRPDVLCVEELTPAVHAALRDDGGLPEHACTAERRRSAGTGLWSRWPLEDAEVIDAGHTLIGATVPALGVAVAAVHMVAPAKRRQVHRWWASFDTVDDFAERNPGPLVLAGDWNATAAHGPLRRLLTGGRLRDAHTDTGRRFARTWPGTVPVALLDRVLVSPEIAVRSITEHRVPGSDHRAVTADLTVVR